MSEEIKIENDKYAATFIINNGQDYDICQLFEKDKQYDRVILLNDWVRRDFFNACMREKDKEIADLKNGFVKECTITHDFKYISKVTDEQILALADPNPTIYDMVKDIIKDLPSYILAKAKAENKTPNQVYHEIMNRIGNWTFH